MDEFYENRDTYLTIKEYIPQLFAFINDTASAFEKIIEEDKQRTPRVVETSPASGAVLNSDKLIIKFSRPMFGAYGFVNRIIEFRSIGDHCRSKEVFNVFPVMADGKLTKLSDISNTIVNWIEYTQLARREDDNRIRISRG